MTYKILVTGSRDWSDREGLRQAMAREIARAGGDDVLLVSGACPSGADMMAEEFFNELGLTIERHPANWKKYGKRAGFKRNRDMVEFGANVCVAFIKDGSNGATHTANLAQLAGIETIRHIL